MICFATDERCIPDRAEYNPVAAANRRVGCPARYQSQQIIQAQHNANGGLDCAASPGRWSFLAAPAGQNHIGCQVCQSPPLSGSKAPRPRRNHRRRHRVAGKSGHNYGGAPRVNIGRPDIGESACVRHAPVPVYFAAVTACCKPAQGTARIQARDFWPVVGPARAIRQRRRCF